MMLRNMRDSDGSPLENSFEAVDERSGEQICTAALEVSENAKLYPSRPLRVRIRLEGRPDDEVFGAVLARARAVCRASGLPARVYASCPAEDEALLRFFEDFGFRDDDGQVRVRRALDNPREVGKLPAGCVMVNDALEPIEERRFFLDRYNELFGTAHDLDWLESFIQRDDFMRILAVAPKGLVNETVVWREGNVGVIGYMQTSRRWRRMGVATEMLKYAARYFTECGLREMTGVVHVRIPGLLRTFERAGFYQDKLLLRYPGIDLQL